MTQIFNRSIEISNPSATLQFEHYHSVDELLRGTSEDCHLCRTIAAAVEVEKIGAHSIINAKVTAQRAPYFSYWITWSTIGQDGAPFKLYRGKQ